MPPRPTRRLGPLTVDIACLGTMTMGRQCAADEAWRQLDAYVADSSAPWIDCAEVYPVPQRADDMGKTEEIIGEWLASKPAGFRERIVLATKVAGPSSGRGALAARERALGGGAAPTAPTPTVEQRHVPDQIRRALQASLKRLRTTYVDLYILHWPDRAVPLWGASNFTEDMSKGAYGMRPKDAPREPLWDKFEDVVRVMGELVGEGKIRAWGLSNETPVGVTLFCETAKRLGLPAPVSIQQDFSLCDRRFETTLLEACSRYGVQLHAYGPLCGGTLTGKYHQAPESAGAGAGAGAGDADAAKRARAGARHVAHGDFQPRYHAAPTMEASLKYFRLAQTLGMTETQLALGWCATRWYMGGVVLGANTVEQLQEDLEAVTNAPARITKAVEEHVDAIHVQRMNPNVTL